MNWNSCEVAMGKITFKSSMFSEKPVEPKNLDPASLRFPVTAAQSDLVLPISEIHVGNRHRKFFDAEKMEVLKDSIREIGLLSPIGVTPTYELIYGGRRLLACQQLGFDAISVRIISNLDELSLLKAEHDENECREPFTAAEKYELVNRLYELFSPEAKERQLHSRFGSRQTENEATLPQPDSPTSSVITQTTAEKVAVAVGLSPATVHNIRTIKNSGNESLETAVLDGTVSVTAAAAKIRKEKKLPPTKTVTSKKSVNLKVSTPDGQVKVQAAIEISSPKVTRAKLDELLHEVLNAIQNTVDAAR
jgi:ParB-like nuclease domain